MKSFITVSLVILLIAFPSVAFSQENTTVEYIPAFKNSNHPQIAYWFLTPEIVSNGKYLEGLDNILNKSPFDLIFLDARNGSNFGDSASMHPVLENIVRKAHERKVRVGFRTRVETGTLPDHALERFLADKAITLDRLGEGSCSLEANLVRSQAPVRTEVFKVYLFRKTAAGFYQHGTLEEITGYRSTVSGNGLRVNIKAGRKYAGYTAFVMAGFYFRAVSNFSPVAITGMNRFIDKYADLPLDGVMLDEYGNARIIPPWMLRFKFGHYRLRLCSQDMARELEARTGEPAGLTLFNMRFAPDGQPEVRARAINVYMDLLRQGPLRVEEAMHDKAMKVYGPGTFVAAHSTFHNALINDEIWATGINWWTIPRDYGFTDEHTPLPTRMGIAISYPANAMYNMYYDRNIHRFSEKALTDLQYGVRTFYHAFNDRQWGMGLEMPVAVEAINPVENCTRMMNRFNPSLPEIRLLVIFGIEALQNWYPEKSQRGRYDINDRLKIEEKAVRLWKAGYMNALVSSDLITNGKLGLDQDNKPVLNGHRFDAVLFLYPQHARESTLQFLEQYVDNGGKLLLEGKATWDFDGKDISERMRKIAAKSSALDFSPGKIDRLGIRRNVISGGCRNLDGSIVMTDIRSLRNNKSKTFKFIVNQDIFTADCIGFSALLANKDHGVVKFAGTGFRELKKNGITLLKLERPADTFVEKKEEGYSITVADSEKYNQLIINNLNIKNQN